MANFFEEALDDVDSLQQKLLGPNYEYWKQVSTPAQIGMSSSGSLSALGTDVQGLIAYVQMLVTGGGSASRSGRPLGNKFFLETGGNCTVEGTSRKASRHIYINNVPDGSIPFVSSGLGTNFSDFRGLVPGLMSNAGRINPFGIFQAFMQGSDPSCRAVTLQTIDVNNNVSQQTRHVAVSDIKSMSPCDFPARRNPITGRPCVEAFSQLDGNTASNGWKMPDDAMAQAYYAAVGALALYMVYRLTFGPREK